MLDALSLSSQAGSSQSDAAGNADEGFSAFANLNEGFLGTGYSSAVEVSLLGLWLILAYVSFSVARYLLAETGLGETVAELLGRRPR